MLQEVADLRDSHTSHSLFGLVLSSGKHWSPILQNPSYKKALF